MAQRLNATQGSLLGLLLDGPKTGWDLLQEVERGLARFWNVTPSHVYRELHALQERKLIVAHEPGARARQPYAVTAAGRRAFRTWMAAETGPEQLRFPLLVKLWFGRHLEHSQLVGLVDASREEHDERLQLYQGVHADDPYAAAVVGFGVAYETAVVEWLSQLREQLSARDPGG